MNSLSTILITATSTSAMIGIIIFICRSWLVERLKAAIKHEYDVKKLEVERKKEIRAKSEIVAELLAEWVRRDDSLDYHKLNKLSFQAYLWLPKSLAEDLANFLTNEKDSKDVQTLLQLIRIHLHDGDDGLSSEHVIVFDEPELYLHTKKSLKMGIDKL